VPCRTTGEFTAESTLQCPDCGVDIWVGTGGHRNLDIHHTLTVCCAGCDQQKACTWPKPAAKANQTLHSFFKARLASNPPLVSMPLPIHAPEIITKQAVNENDALMPPDAPTSDLTSPREDETEACAIALELLSRLQIAIECIPSDNPLATMEHQLNKFSKHPSTIV